MPVVESRISWKSFGSGINRNLNIMTLYDEINYTVLPALLRSFTSSGLVKRVRFFRYSPSVKNTSPWTGVTSPESEGSRIQMTDTFPNRPLSLTTG